MRLDYFKDAAVASELHLLLLVLLLVKVSAKVTRPLAVFDLNEYSALDLTDTLSGYSECITNLYICLSFAAIQAIASYYDLTLTVV
jgi:hypothetical protein